MLCSPLKSFNNVLLLLTGFWLLCRISAEKETQTCVFYLLTFIVISNVGFIMLLKPCSAKACLQKRTKYLKCLLYKGCHFSWADYTSWLHSSAIIIISNSPKYTKYLEKHAKCAAYSYHFQCTGRKWSCLVNCFPVHKKRRKEWEHAQLIMQTCGTGNMRCCLVSALGRRFIWQVFEKLSYFRKSSEFRKRSVHFHQDSSSSRVCKIKVAITFPTGVCGVMYKLFLKS